MTKPIPNHQCGYYCVPPQHAIEAIFPRNVTAEDIPLYVNLNAYAYGWRTLEVRPAPEADRAAWEAGPLRDDHHNPGPDACCWLVIVVPLPEAT